MNYCRRYLTVICFLTFTLSLSSQFSFDSVFHSSKLLKRISASPAKYRLQIIYTQIDRENNKPVFKDYLFNVSPENYFYCASLIKMPVSVLALEKLKELDLKRDMIMFTDSTITCHRKVKKDITSKDSLPSIENYIKRMLLVSDNESFSRAYEFLGVDYIHNKLSQKGYPDVRIINRYDGNCRGKDNFITNPVMFYNKNGKLVYRQEEMRSSKVYGHPLKSIKVGVAYLNSENQKVKGPKDFSGTNHISLRDCHNFLRELIFDEVHAFKLSGEERSFLIDQMTMFPRQSDFPKYDSKNFYDSYKKYLYYGDTRVPLNDTNVLITNIVGQSYGFLSDCAFIHDKKNGIEFMLSAVIYANEDEFINGRYDYNTIGFPYLAELGRQFYNYELRRKTIEKK